MKKILIFILLLLFVQPASAKHKNTPIPQEGGYSGTLPDVTDRFQKSVPKTAAPIFDSVDGFNNQNQLKSTPRDNPAFVNIILKKDKTSQYINDLNGIIPILEKISTSIEGNYDLQKFNAQAYYLKENVEFFRDKYQNKSESSYISYKKLMQLNMQVQTVALLRSESAAYSPYLAYGEEGAIYNSNNINQQLEYLLAQINDTLIVLREAR